MFPVSGGKIGTLIERCMKLIYILL